MREIITVQIGQCGNRVGQEFWEVVSDEHGINRDGEYCDMIPPQLKRISVYYNEAQGTSIYAPTYYLSWYEVVMCKIGSIQDRFVTSAYSPPDIPLSVKCPAAKYPATNRRRPFVMYPKSVALIEEGKFFPRAILTDLEPGVLHSIQGDSCSQLFNTNNFIAGPMGAANNFAKGYYVGGPEVIDALMEVVRGEVECCESLQGFQLVHSLGGGTGSGFGSLLMVKIKEDYPDLILNNYSIIPSEKVSDVVVEPYNTVLSLRYLTEYSDSTFCIDNEALFNICNHTLRIRKPLFSDLNQLISIAMSGITTCFRFPAELNTDLRKLATNMVPYPRLHFYIPGFLPLTTKHCGVPSSMPVKDLSKGILEPGNMLVACNPRKGKYLTVAAVFRGHMSVTEVEHEMNNVQEENEKFFVDWLANNMKIAVCNIPSRGKFDSATFIVNTTSIQEIFKKILEKYRKMQDRKAFLHWYLGEGMEEEEFKNAETSLVDLISEYERQASDK